MSEFLDEGGNVLRKLLVTLPIIPKAQKVIGTLSF